jgi:cell fate regulator YaaT (PSP1 superfamily)|tara:strand:+ start:4487 stop:5614 length:1128 start_codon:yes stop_codon:yes gene_type:complete
MGCSSCSSNSNGTPLGCKNNGTCGSDGCNKMTVFNWLSNMDIVMEKENANIIEVRFKNGRKEFYKNIDELSISIGDLIVVKAEKGYDLGHITLKGGLIPVQMKKKQIDPNKEFFPILRKATQKDIDIWAKSREKEKKIQKTSREMAIRLDLKMKISDIEFQGDGSKATFYYTAAGRVDFRQLIREMAREFKIRIEMKQVGLREEASRLGGIGSCGRELCCSTWLNDFRSVTTSAARYQQLALNPQKLAGQCGKLKCCLNYELDFYQEALKDFPKSNTKILTEKGIAYCQKIDIFKGLLWFVYKNDSVNWHELSAEKVKEILKINAEGKKINSLEDYVSFKSEENQEFQNVVGQDSLTRFDKKKKKRKSKAKAIGK